MELLLIIMLSFQDKPPLTVVDSLDVSRYMGTWYEIARLPNPFQGKCTGEVTATYSLLDDGQIKVINRCRREDGSYSEAEGRARRASKDDPNTKLEVRFAPAFLSWLPWVWGNYWIIDLAEDYSYVVIGEPDREYFWILARTSSLDETVMEGIRERAVQKGYDLSGLMMTVQTKPG